MITWRLLGFGMFCLLWLAAYRGAIAAMGLALTWMLICLATAEILAAIKKGN